MDLKRSVHGYSIDSLRIHKTETFEVNHQSSANSFRRILAQVIACSSINLILFDIGLALSYPTLVIPQLLDNNAAAYGDFHNGSLQSNWTEGNGNFLNENSSHLTMSDNKTLLPTRDPFYQLSFFKHFTMTEYETSWYVSIVYICQPIGSILGGSIIEMTGRKRLMQGLNLFMLLGWVLPFFSTGAAFLYLSNILLGIGIGCGEAPIATYLGEVTQVSVRGVLLNLAQVFLSISFLAPYLVSLMISSWRWQALVLSSLPIITFIVCSLIPETPVWLISKGRYKDAESSLKWLRGWTSSDQVKEELEEINAYHLRSTRSASRSSVISQSQKSTENLFPRKEEMREKVRYFISPRMRRPFIIICTMFALLFITGMGAIRPYMVLIFKQIHITMDPDTCALWVTFAGAVGNIVSLLIIKFSGKRFIVLSALSCSAVCTLMIALIKMNLISSSLSFVTFMGISFFSGYGIIPIPWMLQSELYPFRGRGVASGVGAAFCYIVGFISTKVYLEVANLISLEGVFIVFTCFSIYGVIFLWFLLPETEGKTFEQIDDYFKNDNKNKRYC